MIEKVHSPQSTVRRKVIKYFFLIIFITVNCQLSTVNSVFGAFIDPGWGTRGAGKGGAFIATADDASSVTWNPAALSLVFMREGMFSYHKPYAGLEGLNLSMGYFAVVFPVNRIANFGGAVSSFNGDDVYKENIYQFTAARELSELIGINPMRLAAGISLKYLSHSYVWDEEILALNDPITEEDSAGAITADLGILFQPNYKIPVGLTVKNLIPADVGIANEDIVPMEIALGAAFKAGNFQAFEEITPEIKIGYRNHEERSKIDYAIGIESWLAMHTIGLRTGINKNEFALGVSFEKYFGMIGIRLDYAALISYKIGGNLGSHRVATTIKF